jgi:hypothetical protein
MCPMTHKRGHKFHFNTWPLARSEGFEPPALGIEIRCSIQLSYERVRALGYQSCRGSSTCRNPGMSGKGGKTTAGAGFLAGSGCLTNSQHTKARVLPSGPRRTGFFPVPTGFTGFPIDPCESRLLPSFCYRCWPPCRRAPICASPAITAAMSPSTRRSTSASAIATSASSSTASAIRPAPWCSASCR